MRPDTPLVVDVSSYSGVCPHCEEQTGFFWRKGKFAGVPKSCPCCGAGPKRPDWHKPPMEVALFVSQRRYLAARDIGIPGSGEKELEVLWRQLWQYATGFVKKKTVRKVTMLPHVVVEKAYDAAVLFVEYYLKNPDFKIQTSFGVYLDYQVKAVLYNVKEFRFNHSESLENLSEEVVQDSLEIARFLNTLNNDSKLIQDYFSPREVFRDC